MENISSLKKNDRLGTFERKERLNKITYSLIELTESYAKKIVAYKEPDNLVKEVSSKDKWFKSLINHLKVATSLKAYLKEFQAPPETWKSNLEVIFEINHQFARLIHEHEKDTNIVGYFPSNLPPEKSPIDWLTREVSKYNNGDLRIAESKVLSSVNLINNQPMANSYTVYFIDNTRLFYNFLSPKGNYEFFDIELSSSIIPYFLNLGFKQFITEINK